MFIIFGVGSRKSTVKSGQFRCPRCNVDRSYTHKKVTRYFTLFFIPVIPLNEVGDFVECNTCKDTYYPRVLDQKTDAQIADIASIGIRHVVTSMLLADGVVDVREKIAALDVANKFSKTPYSLDQLEKDLESLDRTQFGPKLRELGSILSDSGKETIIVAAVFLAWSDGNADETELEMIQEIGKRFKMRRSAVDDITNRTLRQLEARAASEQPTAEPA